jgi:hypothetical protein
MPPFCSPPQTTIGYINCGVFKTPCNTRFTSVKAFSCLGGLTTQSGDPIYKTPCNFPAQADAEEKNSAAVHLK